MTCQKYRFQTQSLSILLFLACLLSSLHACITVTALDSKPPVLTGEQAVIIWDEERKIEHFIRQVDIRSASADIGFIVPTPSTPELVEADPSIFQQASYAAEPEKVVFRTPLDVIGPLFGGPFWMYGNPFGSIVKGVELSTRPIDPQIIREQNVGDYHAVTLEADNPASLERWLKDNGYAWPENAEAWLKPYVAAGWKITAFKLIKKTVVVPDPANPNAEPILSRAIRMSFVTDRPFFPYSEPRDSDQTPKPGGRTLTLAILSNEPMAGSLADGNAWPGILQYSGATKDTWDNDPNFLRFAKLDDPKDKTTLPRWLTYFTDTSNPRPGTADLYFSPSANQAPMRRIEAAKYGHDKLQLTNIAADLICLLIITIVVGSFTYSGIRLVASRYGKTSLTTTTTRGFSILDRYCGLVTLVLAVFPGLTYALFAAFLILGGIFGAAVGSNLFQSLWDASFGTVGIDFPYPLFPYQIRLLDCLIALLMPIVLAAIFSAWRCGYRLVYPLSVLTTRWTRFENTLVGIGTILAAVLFVLAFLFKCYLATVVYPH